MIGDQKWQRDKFVQLIVDGFQLTASAHEEAVIIQLFSIITAHTFNIQITPKSLEENNVLSFCFERPIDIYEFIVENKKKLKVSKDGVLVADVIFLGKSKTIKIQTQKVIVGDKQLLQKALQMLQEAYRVIEELQEKYGVQEKEKMKIQRNSESFQVDHSGEHFKSFEQIGNKIKKISNGGLYKNIFGKQLAPNAILTFKVRQIKTSGPSGNQMFYGVGSNRIRDKDNHYDKPGDALFYFSYNPAYLYPGAKNLTTSGAKEGQIIETIINTKNWTVIWNLNGNQLATMSIPQAMRNEPLFPVIIIYYLGSEIQLL